MSNTVVIGDYVVTRHLGAGSFATVYKGHHRTTGDVVAIKAISLRRLDRKSLENLEGEISIMRRVKHHNIVRMLDVQKSEKFIYLILEYCGGGDLSRLIRKKGPLPEKRAQGLMKQLAAGLHFLWSNNLIHRDLKPQNLLLTSDGPKGVLKIADFGFARHLAQASLAETLCGSPLYMAPEILRYQKYDAKADLWSVGAILFEMLAKRPPFTGANHIQLLQNIERQELRLPDGLVVSTPCLHLLRGLLTRNPHMRISFQDFFTSPFISVTAGVAPSQTTQQPKVPKPGASSSVGSRGKPKNDDVSAGSGGGASGGSRQTGRTEQSSQDANISTGKGARKPPLRAAAPPSVPSPATRSNNNNNNSASGSQGGKLPPVPPAAATSTASTNHRAQPSDADGEQGSKSATQRSAAKKLAAVGTQNSVSPQVPSNNASKDDARTMSLKTPTRTVRQRHSASVITSPVVPANLEVFGVDNTPPPSAPTSSPTRTGKTMSSQRSRYLNRDKLNLLPVPRILSHQTQPSPQPGMPELPPRERALPPPPDAIRLATYGGRLRRKKKSTPGMRRSVSDTSLSSPRPTSPLPRRRHNNGAGSSAGDSDGVSPQPMSRGPLGQARHGGAFSGSDHESPAGSPPPPVLTRVQTLSGMDLVTAMSASPNARSGASRAPGHVLGGNGVGGSPPRRSASASSLTQVLARGGQAAPQASPGGVSSPVQPLGDSDDFVLVSSKDVGSASAVAAANGGTVADGGMSPGQSAATGSSGQQADGSRDASSDADATPLQQQQQQQQQRQQRQQRRDRALLRRAVAFAHHIGVQASAIAELAFQIMQLRVNPMAANDDGDINAGGRKFGFRGFTALMPYLGDSTAEQAFVRQSHARALALYVKALGMFYEGLSVKDTLPSHLTAPVGGVASPPTVAGHTSGGDASDVSDCGEGSPNLDQRLRAQWLGVYAWLRTCLTRCMCLAEACAEQLPGSRSAEPVCAEELLYARALRVGATAGAKEEKLRAEVAAWRERASAAPHGGGGANGFSEGSVGGNDVVKNGRALTCSCKALADSYSNGALLLGVLSRGTPLPKLDKIRLAAFGAAFTARVRAAKRLESELRREVGVLLKQQPVSDAGADRSAA